MPDPSGSLRIYAPGSLSPLREAILVAFHQAVPEVDAEFAPPAYSGVLAERIRAGAPADVFISANIRYPTELHVAGLAGQPQPMARNRLSLVSRAGLEPPLASVADLARPGLRLVIPPPIDPLGEYALQMLERAGLATAISAKRGNDEVREHLASLRNWLATGEVDAAVLYASMVNAFPGTRSLALPPALDMHDQVLFAICVIGRDGAPHPAAGRFVSWMLGPAGQATLRAGGFLPLD
ncbi:MAG: substrate-binding domain-containing protein [Thermomicrobiales bacterium]|nr:substrate-binding domain-containing protein [Thermomicrobiales bacterium]